MSGKRRKKTTRSQTKLSRRKGKKSPTPGYVYVWQLPVPLKEELSHIDHWRPMDEFAKSQGITRCKLLCSIGRKDGKYIGIYFKGFGLFITVDDYAEIYRFTRCPHCGQRLSL